MDECGAVVIPDTEPAAQYIGWGQESVSALLKPFQSGPRVELVVERDLQLDDLNLYDATIALFPQASKSR